MVVGSSHKSQEALWHRPSYWALQIEVENWSPGSFVVLEFPFNIIFIAILFLIIEASKELQKFTKRKKEREERIQHNDR